VSERPWYQCQPSPAAVRKAVKIALAKEEHPDALRAFADAIATGDYDAGDVAKLRARAELLAGRVARRDRPKKPPRRRRSVAC
jgi:hypothetical protein